MNRQLDRHNKSTITKAYQVKKNHFHGTKKNKRAAQKRKEALIERTKARIKRAKAGENEPNPIHLVPGGQVVSIDGVGAGTVIGYEPKRQLLLAVGHVAGCQYGSQVQEYPALREPGKPQLTYDIKRRGKAPKIRGVVGIANEYGILVRYTAAPDTGELLEIGLAVPGKAVAKNEALEGGEKEIHIYLERQNGAISFRLPELAHGMSGSPIVQDGRLVGCVTHGTDRGQAYGLQMVEIIGGLLDQADAVDWERLECLRAGDIAQRAADQHEAALREALGRLEIAADEMERVVAGARDATMRSIGTLKEGEAR